VRKKEKELLRKANRESPREGSRKFEAGPKRKTKKLEGPAQLHFKKKDKQRGDISANYIEK